MKKNSYEYLIYATDEIYKKIDTASSTLCGLKDLVLRMSELIRAEYQTKYEKKPAGDKLCDR